MFRTDQQIGDYFLVKRLGRGGFGEVWLAERRTKFVTTKVAVKLPLDDQVDHNVIKQEAELWERASGHPNVLPIIEANEYDGQVIIVSEFAPDGSLQDLLTRVGGLPVQRAIDMTLGILSGLDFLHSKNIIHRDLKPANILLQGDTPRLADFGISRIMKTLSASMNAAGTPTYMAPEAFDRKRNVQTDIWSVGVVLYQMLAGTLPFPSEDIRELMMAIVMQAPQPLSDRIPSDLRAIVAKTLEKDAGRRYRSASELKEDLYRFLYKTPRPYDAGSAQTTELFAERKPTVSLRGEGQKTIAILPFRNLSGNTASQFYEFSLADAVITELARLRGLVVRPSFMIANYQGKTFDPREAGKEMAVDTVLSAAFIQSETRLRVTAQLLDVFTGDIIWSDRIDTETSDIFALQDTITQHIIHGLEFDLSVGEQERLGVRPTKNNEAYEEYLRGRDRFARFIFRTLSPADCEAAIASFERAVEIDPKFALAWSGLGACFANRVFRALGKRQDYVRAEEAFRRALEIDPNIPESRVLMGFIYLSRGEKKKARLEAIRVVNQFPNEAPPYFLRAVIHRLDGEYDEALNAWDKLERLHPRSTVIANWNRARIYSLQGDHERALNEIDKGALLEPNHPFIEFFRGQILYDKGNVGAACRILRAVTTENPHLVGMRPLLATALAADGQTNEARDNLSEEALESAAADGDLSYWVSSAYALLGDLDESFEWLQRAIKLGLEDTALFERDRSLENLRSDRRYRQIMQQISKKDR